MISSRFQTSARIFSRILSPAEPLGREPGLQLAVDRADVEVDLARLVLGHGKPRLRPIDAELIRSRVDRRLGPAVEHRILADGQRQLLADFLKRTGCSSMRAQLVPLGDRLQAPLRQPHQHQRGGDGEGADPVERLQRLAIGQPADQRRDRRLGQQRQPDDERRQRADRVDEQALPDRPGC